MKIVFLLLCRCGGDDAGRRRGTGGTQPGRGTVPVAGRPYPVAIVRRLAASPARVTDLVTDLGLAQSTMSKHLACLRDCGLVASEPAGRASVFRIEQPAPGRDAHCGGDSAGRDRQRRRPLPGLELLLPRGRLRQRRPALMTAADRERQLSIRRRLLHAAMNAPPDRYDRVRGSAGALSAEVSHQGR